MDTEISLCYWILGLDNANVFSVTIPTLNLVDNLKDAIREKNKNRLNQDPGELKRSPFSKKHLLGCFGNFKEFSEGIFVLIRQHSEQR